MRVYLQPPQPSRGLDRIATALARYAPSTVEICQFPRNVDLTVIYAIGRRQHIERQVADILERGKQYAVIQVCLKSTMNPDVRDWVDIWKDAKVLWSYYDLFATALDDGLYIQGMDNFLHAPLGVDGQAFTRRNMRDRYSAQFYGVHSKFIIATSGSNRLQESIRECVLAAQEVNRSVFHLGVDLEKRYPNIRCVSGISDEELADNYAGCEFVSGLRRTEGFELPAAEGLLCGARPVLFDSADYRFNYKHWGRYIREGTRQEVVEQLVELFKQGAEPVSAAERKEAAHWFNWERVCGEFWQRCLQ